MVDLILGMKSNTVLFEHIGYLYGIVNIKGVERSCGLLYQHYLKTLKTLLTLCTILYSTVCSEMIVHKFLLIKLARRLPVT